MQIKYKIYTIKLYILQRITALNIILKNMMNMNGIETEMIKSELRINKSLYKEYCPAVNV